MWLLRGAARAPASGGVAGGSTTAAGGMSEAVRAGASRPSAGAGAAALALGSNAPADRGCIGGSVFDVRPPEDGLSSSIGAGRTRTFRVGSPARGAARVCVVSGGGRAVGAGGRKGGWELCRLW